MVLELSKSLLSWLSSTAQLNNKHADIFKLQNLMFLEDIMTTALPSTVSSTTTDLYQYFPSMKTLIADNVVPTRVEAEGGYILWMISYELEHLGSFATRIDKLGFHVRDEEITLYLTR